MISLNLSLTAAPFTATLVSSGDVSGDDVTVLLHYMLHVTFCINTSPKYNNNNNNHNNNNNNNHNNNNNNNDGDYYV